MLVRSFSNPIQVFECEGFRESIDDSVNMRYWYNTARIVELGGASIYRSNHHDSRVTYQIEQERISTAAHRLPHASVRYSRRSVRGRQHEIQFLTVPPFVPIRFVCLPL